jgi:hypothetical protein
MNLAHVMDGVVLAIYPSQKAPRSYKGELLPVVETERPAPKDGSSWAVNPVVFEDRVELAWVDVPWTAEEREAVDNVAEISRIRTIIEALRTGQGTAAERLARLERVVGHLCKLTLQA